MKTIEIFERAIAEKKGSLKDYGINGTMFWAYRRSMERGNDLIDFNEMIPREEIEEIANACRENGVTEFTISSGFSGLTWVLADFEAQGFKMAGLTTVKGYITDFESEERVDTPAILMRG